MTKKYEKTTNISWANKTWNVIAGCALVSPACTNCYAMLCVKLDVKLKYI